MALDDAVLVLPQDAPRLEVRSGESISGLIIKAEPGCRITGRICDAQTGGPLEGVQLFGNRGKEHAPSSSVNRRGRTETSP